MATTVAPSAVVLVVMVTLYFRLVGTHRADRAEWKTELHDKTLALDTEITARHKAEEELSGFKAEIAGLRRRIEYLTEEIARLTGRHPAKETR